MVLMIIVGIYAIAVAKIRFTRTFQLTGERARAYGLTLLVLAVPEAVSVNAFVRLLPTAISNRVVVSILTVVVLAFVMFGLAIAFRHREISASGVQTTSEQTQQQPHSVGAPSTTFGWTSALAFSAAAGSVMAVVSAVLLGTSAAISRPAPAWVGLLCIYLPASNVLLTLVVTAVKSRSAPIAIGATAFSLLFLYEQSLIFMAVAGEFGLHVAAAP